MAIISLSQILQQKADVLQSLRDRTKTYLSKFGYSQKVMAAAVGISETYLNDFLNGRRGISEVPFAKIEHVLSLKADQRKLQFYTGGNTGTRMCNLQAKGKTLKGQVKFGDSYGDVIQETKAAYSKINQEKMEA
jgi:transcriptional regulator with XRE-family HTH domain